MSDKKEKSPRFRRPSEPGLKNLKDDKKEKEKDKDKDKKGPMTITGPVNVVHVGHVGFDSAKGRFEWHGLPEVYQRLFTNLDKTLQSMGVKGLTQQEAKLLIKALPTLGMKDPSQPPTTTKKLSESRKNEKDIEVSAPILKQSSTASKLNQPVTVLSGDAVTALKEALQKQHVKVEELKLLVDELKEENARLTKKLEEAKQKNESVAALKEKLKDYETNLTLRTKATEEKNTQIEKYKKRAEKYKKKYRDVSAENENLKLQLANFSEIQHRLDQKANRATVQIDDVYKQLKLENEGLKSKLERESNKRREIEKEKHLQDSKLVELQTSLKHAKQEIEELKQKLDRARQSSRKYKSRLEKVQKELEKTTVSTEVTSESTSSQIATSSSPRQQPTSSEPTKSQQPQPQSQQPQQQTTTTTKSTTSSTSTPIPPPPPTPPKAPPPPPAPSTSKTPTTDNKSNPKSSAQVLPSTAGRDALLESIRNSDRNLLRHVDLEEVTKKGPVDVDDQNVLNLIAKAIISRRTAIADDEELGRVDDNESWDD